MKNVVGKDGITTFGQINAAFLAAFNAVPQDAVLPFLLATRKRVAEEFNEQVRYWRLPDDALRRDHICSTVRDLVAERLVAHEIDILIELTHELNSLASKEQEWR